jgi:hypothetical protein
VAGVEAVTILYTGPTPVQDVISWNLHRRHLTPDQLAVVALKVERAEAVEAKKRQLSTLKQNSRDDPSDDGAWECECGARWSGDYCHTCGKNRPKSVKVKIPERSKGQARDIAGKKVGVSGTNVSKAKALEKKVLKSWSWSGRVN